MNREKHSGAVWSYPLWISFWRISTLPLSPSFFFVLKISCQSPNVWVFFIGFSRSALFYPALCSREQPLLPSGFELCWPIGGPWWQVGWREVTPRGVYFPGSHSVRLLWWLPRSCQAATFLIPLPDVQSPNIPQCFSLRTPLHSPKSFCLSLSVYHIKNQSWEFLNTRIHKHTFH